MPHRPSQKTIENDKRIQEALDGLLKDQYPSVRAAVKAHDVNHVTLNNRMKGGRSIAESREDHQNLSIAEEKALSRWIIHMTATGHPVRHGFIREMAQQIQKSRHHDPTKSPSFYPAIGDSWIQCFLHRHPHLITIISCIIKAAHLKEISKEAINKWFDEFVQAITENQISDENKYNMDETGSSIGAIKGTQVVIDKILQTKYQTHPGRQEWVTVVECVSVDGQSISPLIILKGKNVSSSWIPKKALEKDIHFACSPLDWTNRELSLY